MTPEEAMEPVLAAVDDAAHEAWKGGDHGDFPAKRAAVWDAIVALVVEELETVGKAWPLGCQCHTCTPLKARLAEWRAGRIER